MGGKGKDIADGGITEYITIEADVRKQARPREGIQGDRPAETLDVDLVPRGDRAGQLAREWRKRALSTISLGLDGFPESLIYGVIT